MSPHFFPPQPPLQAPSVLHRSCTTILQELEVKTPSIPQPPLSPSTHCRTAARILNSGRARAVSPAPGLPQPGLSCSCSAPHHSGPAQRCPFCGASRTLPSAPALTLSPWPHPPPPQRAHCPQPGRSVAHWLVVCPPDWDTRSLTAGAVLSCPSQNPRRPPRAVPVSTTRRPGSRSRNQETRKSMCSEAEHTEASGPGLQTLWPCPLAVTRKR